MSYPTILRIRQHFERPQVDELRAVVAAEMERLAPERLVRPGYHGAIESGILKMMMIGLGKHAGALAYHRILLEEPYDTVVRSVARTVLARAPIAFGLAVVENAYEETARIEAIAPAEIERREE